MPVSLRKELVNLLHESHMGKERTKARARQVVYWPKFGEAIHDVVSTCEACLRNRPQQCKESLLQHKVPSLPWGKVGIDFMEFKQKSYVLIVDYYSKFPELVCVSNKTAEAAIVTCKLVFARHGIPKTVFADNMPFASKELVDYAREWGFEVVTSSPGYPQSNGLVERNVRTIKSILLKCLESGVDPYISILEFRTTPVSRLEWSPAEL